MPSSYTTAKDKTAAAVFGQLRGGYGSGRLTLRTNFLWTFTGNVVYAACQWGVLMVLAKLGTPQTVGEFALALAIASPLMISSRLALRVIQATDAASEYDFGDYLSLRLLTTGAAGLVLVGIIWLSGYGWRLGAVILIVGLVKTLESISDIFWGLLQRHERMDRVGLSSMIEGPLSLMAIAGAIYLSGDLLLGVSGWAAIRALILVGFDARNGASVLREVSGSARPGAGPYSRLARCLLPLRRKPRVLVNLTALTLPIGIVTALYSLTANIPRYFIEHHLGTRALGIFAALAYPLAAGTVVVNALAQSALPRLARHYADGDYRAFSSLLRKLLCLGFALGTGGVLFIWLAGRRVLLLLYQPEYATHVGTFLWLGVAAGIGYAASLLGYAVTAARYLRAPLPVYLIVILVTAAGCAILVPHYQLPGAAIAMTLAAICQIVGNALVVNHALRKAQR